MKKKWAKVKTQQKLDGGKNANDCCFGGTRVLLEFVGLHIYFYQDSTLDGKQNESSRTINVRSMTVRIVGAWQCLWSLYHGCCCDYGP